MIFASVDIHVTCFVYVKINLPSLFPFHSDTIQFLQKPSIIIFLQDVFEIDCFHQPNYQNKMLALHVHFSCNRADFHVMRWIGWWKPHSSMRSDRPLFKMVFKHLFV